MTGGRPSRGWAIFFLLPLADQYCALAYYLAAEEGWGCPHWVQRARSSFKLVAVVELHASYIVLIQFDLDLSSLCLSTSLLPPKTSVSVYIMEKIQVLRLAFVYYQHPDLTKALTFLKDFGFVEAQTSANKVFLRGFGIDPYLYVAEQSPDSERHFLGGFWTVSSQEDLKKAAAQPGASSIFNLDGPGAGQAVTLRDPNNFVVGFVFGQEEREKGGSHDLEQGVTEQNSTALKPRKGDVRRFRNAPCPVHKLGHYGFVVPENKFRETLYWYYSIMNLAPTDTVFDPATGKDQTTFNHIDLGDDYTDHHVRSTLEFSYSPACCTALTLEKSLFVASGPLNKPAYIHHSSFEVNDFDTQELGHDWLREKGWVNCWGIGRHVLGSQIFDYW